MSKYSDPLGIERIVEQTKELHRINPISEDLAEEWNNHPVTKHLKQYLQMDLLERLKNTSTPASSEIIALYETVLDYPVLKEGVA